MTIRVTCAKCGSHLKIKDELAGKRGHCPKCKADLAIPALAEAEEAAPTATIAPAAVPDSDASLHAAESDAETPAETPAATNGDVPFPEPAEALMAAAGRDTVSAATADDDTAVSVPLSLEPDDDLDEAPALIGTPLPPTKPKPKPKPKSDDFDPADFLMEESPVKKPPVRGAGRSGPNLDLIDEYAKAEQSHPMMDSRLTPAPPTKSSSAAADAWDHAKAAKQMMRAIKQSNAEELKTRDDSGKESFDFVGAFKELGVKGLGGLAAVLVGALGLYYLSNTVMGGGPKLPPLGYVTGTVTLDGKPLEGAMIFFAPFVMDPASDKRGPMRASNGKSDASGFYRMYYIDKHQGVAVGQARVWLTLMGPNGRDLIPGSYSEGASQMREIKPGSQTFDFELTTKP